MRSEEVTKGTLKDFIKNDVEYALVLKEKICFVTIDNSLKEFIS